MVEHAVAVRPRRAPPPRAVKHTITEALREASAGRSLTASLSVQTTHVGAGARDGRAAATSASRIRMVIAFRERAPRWRRPRATCATNARGSPIARGRERRAGPERRRRIARLATSPTRTRRSGARWTIAPAPPARREARAASSSRARPSTRLARHDDERRARAAPRAARATGPPEAAAPARRRSALTQHDVGVAPRATVLERVVEHGDVAPPAARARATPAARSAPTMTGTPGFRRACTSGSSPPYPRSTIAGLAARAPRAARRSTPRPASSPCRRR